MERRRIVARTASVCLVIAVTALGGQYAARRPPRNPLAGLALAAAVAFDGRVEQRLDAGSYAYLEVNRDRDGKAWVVALGPRATVGDRVHVVAMGRATSFDSRRLGRRFDDLWFAAVRPAPSPADSPPSLP